MWDLVSACLAANRKARVLKALEEGPLDQRRIAFKANLERSNARKAVLALCRLQLVECLTPDRPRSRIYQLTPFGRRVLEEVRKQWDNESNSQT